MMKFSPRKIPGKGRGSGRKHRQPGAPEEASLADASLPSAGSDNEHGAEHERLWSMHRIPTRSASYDGLGRVLVVDPVDPEREGTHWLNASAFYIRNAHDMRLVFRKSRSPGDWSYNGARVYWESKLLVGPYVQLADLSIMQPAFAHEIAHLEHHNPKVCFYWKSSRAIPAYIPDGAEERVFRKKNGAGPYFDQFMKVYKGGFWKDEAEAYLEQARHSLEMLEDLLSGELPLDDPYKTTWHLFHTVQLLDCLPSCLYSLDLFVSLQLYAIENFCTAPTEATYDPATDKVVVRFLVERKRKNMAGGIDVGFFADQLSQWAVAEYADTTSETREFMDRFMSAYGITDPCSPDGSFAIWLLVQRQKMQEFDEILDRVMENIPVTLLASRALGLFRSVGGFEKEPYIDDAARVQAEWEVLRNEGSGIGKVSGLFPPAGNAATGL